MHSAYVTVDVKPFAGDHQLDIAISATYSPAKASELPIIRELQPIRTSQSIFGKGMGGEGGGVKHDRHAYVTIYIYETIENELIVLDRRNNASELSVAIPPQCSE